MTESATEEQIEELASVLKRHDASTCKACSAPIGWGAVAWNNAGTDAGTPFSTIDILCEACGTEVVKIESWFPWMDDLDDVLRVLDEDWGHNI